MNWSDKVFAYCERGNDPGFWAEPLNAISNAAFIIAATAALICWRGSRRGAAEFLLIGIVFSIGIGSFMFHTLATKWARAADVAPISVFMLAYLGFALRRFLVLSWMAVAAGLIAFLGAGAAAEGITCRGGACLNGSLGYLPALGAMIVVAVAAGRRRHPAERGLWTAAAVFALSLVFRSIDMAACPTTLIQPGWRTGTHALWHILNALVLYKLLTAAIGQAKPETLQQKNFAS